MRTIGYHITNGIIANSDGEVCTKPPYLSFLLAQKPESIKVFYHMNYNVANLLRMINITEAEGKRLQDNNRLRITPYTLKQFPGKFFSIKEGYYYNCPFANFGDMNQYKPAKLEEDETIESCMTKAEEARDTGQEVYKILLSLGLHPTTLTSPIKAYEKEILSRINLPTVDDMPEEAGHYAYNCCHGNWLESFQLGHWKQAWDYDINSAYPAELAQLPDLRHGTWHYGNTYPSLKKGILGYCKGIVTITKPFSPIIYSGDMNYTVTGSWEACLTQKTIEFIYKWGLGKFELIDGWWWIPEGNQGRPLGSIIEQLYWEKRQSNGYELGKEVIKRIMSGIWGKFLAVQGRGFGERFNPVYGAETEANVRLKVADFALQHEVMPICIAVDGLVTDRPIMSNITAEQETRLGYWRQTANSPAPCLVTGTGTVAIQGEKKTADFSLDYNWLIEQIRQEPYASEYSMEKLSPVTLAVALNTSWDKLGQLRKVTKTISIGRDPKRCYRVAPKNGQELLSNYYQSEPWDISVVSKPAQQIW